jgi:hypothetical protein
MTLVAALKCQPPIRAARTEVHQAVVACELSHSVLGLPRAAQVGGRSDGDAPVRVAEDVPDVAGAVGRRDARSNRDVHALADEIDQAIFESQLELERPVGGEKLGQTRDDELEPDRDRDADHEATRDRFAVGVVARARSTEPRMPTDSA